LFKDLTSILGSGAFGAVYRGSIQKETEVQVAIKAPKPSSPSTAISGLLAEIKVMTHIGKHENIVDLLGAYTKELKRGKVFIDISL